MTTEFQIDRDYVLAVRRTLHEYPEIGFDLPRTTALVKRELDGLGIPYTEAYGRGSVVATLNGEKRGFTIGLRADMDALPIREAVDGPHRSRIDGAMHACGHDAHTAMLLGAAKAMHAIRDRIPCRVKLLFQPNEEGAESGAQRMVEKGVMDDIDVIIGQHVENTLEVGTIGVCKGAAMAASRAADIHFHGKTAHATLPQTGIDALAMAVRAYTDIQFMLTREMNPFERFVCSVGTLRAGTIRNVVAEDAVMELSIRSYSPEVDALLLRRITAICTSAAADVGGRATVDSRISCKVVYNDPPWSDRLLQSAAKVASRVVGDFRQKLSSEDFSHYQARKPGVFFRLGTGSPGKAAATFAHNNDFTIDEAALPIGAAVFVQFVLDHGANSPSA